MIRTALANGWDVRVTYLDRPAKTAMAASLRRANVSGRVNRLTEVARSYRDAQSSMLDLKARLAQTPGVQFEALTNPGTWDKPKALERLAWNEVAPGENAWHSSTDEDAGENGQAAQAWQSANASDEFDPEVLQRTREPGWHAPQQGSGGPLRGDGRGDSQLRADTGLAERATGQKILASPAIN